MSNAPPTDAFHRQLEETRGRRRAGNGGKAPPPAQAPAKDYDDGMEARLAKLEAVAEFVQRDLTEIKADLREVKRDARTDFRITWGAMIAGFVGLAGLLAKGFGWM